MTISDLRKFEIFWVESSQYTQLAHIREPHSDQDPPLGPQNKT